MFAGKVSIESDALRRIKYWVPAILFAVVISVFSRQSFGEAHISRIIIPFLHAERAGWRLSWAVLTLLIAAGHGVSILRLHDWAQQP
jgi:hypothetical protein